MKKYSVFMQNFAHLLQLNKSYRTLVSFRKRCFFSKQPMATKSSSRKQISFVVFTNACDIYKIIEYSRSGGSGKKLAYFMQKSTFYLLILFAKIPLAKIFSTCY